MATKLARIVAYFDGLVPSKLTMRNVNSLTHITL